MAKGIDKNYNRRLGRVELLLKDLEQLPDGYQPTEREVEMFKDLVAKIKGAIKGVQVDLEPPAAEAPEAAPAPDGKLPKTENGKRKTGT